MRMLVVIAIAAWSSSAWSVEVADFQFSGTMSIRDARTEGIDAKMAEGGEEIWGRAITTGSQTSVNFHIYGVEDRYEFTWDNVTGEVLLDSVLHYINSMDPLEPVPHHTFFTYNMETGDGELQWVKLEAPEPAGQMLARTIPDGAWSPALLGMGIIGLAWRVNRR